MESEFERQAKQNSQIGLLGEFWGFLANNKKWWLLPILITLGLVGALIFLSRTSAAPFIYTLF